MGVLTPFAEFEMVICPYYIGWFVADYFFDEVVIICAEPTALLVLVISFVADFSPPLLI
jgi:hypothetical protein